jgi:hypothetical protein
MLYYINYSCGCGENEEIVSAGSREDVDNYAYQKAIDEYESYEGLHGIRGISDIIAEEFVEEEMIEEDYKEADEIYREEVENNISYSVEEYDEEKYGWLLEEQETAYEI